DGPARPRRPVPRARRAVVREQPGPAAAALWANAPLPRPAAARTQVLSGGGAGRPDDRRVLRAGGRAGRPLGDRDRPKGPDRLLRHRHAGDRREARPGRRGVSERRSGPALRSLSVLHGRSPAGAAGPRIRGAATAALLLLGRPG